MKFEKRMPTSAPMVLPLVIDPHEMGFLRGTTYDVNSRNGSTIRAIILEYLEIQHPNPVSGDNLQAISDTMGRFEALTRRVIKLMIDNKEIKFDPLSEQFSLGNAGVKRMRTIPYKWAICNAAESAARKP